MKTKVVLLMLLVDEFDPFSDFFSNPVTFLILSCLIGRKRFSKTIFTLTSRKQKE